MSDQTPPFVPMAPPPGRQPAQRPSGARDGIVGTVAPGYATRPQYVHWIPREGWPADLSFLTGQRPVKWRRDGQEFDTREEADAAFAEPTSIVDTGSAESYDPLASTDAEGFYDPLASPDGILPNTAPEDPEVDEPVVGGAGPMEDEPVFPPVPMEQAFAAPAAPDPAVGDALLAAQLSERDARTPTMSEAEIQAADKPARTARRGGRKSAAQKTAEEQAAREKEETLSREEGRTPPAPSGVDFQGFIEEARRQLEGAEAFLAAATTRLEVAVEAFRVAEIELQEAQMGKQYATELVDYASQHPALQDR